MFQHFRILLFWLLTLYITHGESGWEPACTQSCTKQFSGGIIWPCEIEKRDDCTRLPYSGYPPAPRQKLPPQPKKMDVNLYTATKDNLTFPAFNISATLDLMTGSSYISGLQFIIRGLTNHHEFNFDYFSREICHNYNLSAADTSWVEGVPSNVTYYMDCFKPLSPESEYEIEVIVVPIAKDYKKNAVKTIRTPSCSKHPEFSECSLTEKPENWTPIYLNITTEYDIVMVTFSLPPPEYKLRRFGVYLYEDSNVVRDHQVLPNITHNLSPLHFHGDELVVVTDVFRLIKPGIYILKILPMPDDQTITTTVTRSHNFTVIGSPCHSGPCGNGNCTVVNVYQYNCTCDDGYSNKNSNDSCFRDESQSGRSFNNPTTVVILATVGAIVALILVLAICRFRKHHGSTSTSMRPPDGTEIERLITPTNERVLVIYPNDSDKYVCLVELMCRFLRLYGLDVRLNTWEQSHIKVNGLEQWLNDEFDKANTILLFITAGFRQKWAKELDPAQTKHRFFCYAKQHILRDIEQGVTCPRKGKYVCAYFPFSNEYEIPNELRSFGEPGVYKLPEKFEDLYMELLGQVKSTPAADFSIPKIKDKLQDTLLGKELLQAIEEMTDTARSNPSWYEDISGNEAGLPQKDSVRRHSAESFTV